MGNYDRDGVPVDGQKLDMHIMPRAVTLFGDYNLRPWRRVSFFGGLGAGYANVINQRQGETGLGIGNTTRDNLLIITPRVGAEFFHRIRLTVDCKIIPKSYTCLGVNLGFVFGGGTKR